MTSAGGEPLYTLYKRTIRIMVPRRDSREAILEASRRYYAHRAYYGDLLSRRPAAAKVTNRELDFIEKAFKANATRPVKDVLDVACGGGRHVVGLAHRGYRCTGQDYTRERVQMAKALAKREKVAVRFLQGDATRLSYRNRFDAVLALNILFLLPSDEDVERALGGIYRALRPGGVVVCNFFNPFYFEKGEFSDVLYRGVAATETHAPGIRYTDITRLEDLDRVHGVAWFRETDIVEAQDGKHVFRDRERVRFFTYWDLSRYLRDAGFSEVKCYPDLKIKTPKKPKAEELAFVARK